MNRPLETPACLPERGEGADPGAHPWLWRLQGKLESTFRHLAADYHVVVPDLPGFGESSRLWEENYDVDSQVERLHAFFAAIKLRGSHLVGNSMGGQIACTYAARYPDEVLSLTLSMQVVLSSPEPAK